MAYRTHKFDIVIPPQDIGENPKCSVAIANGNKAAFEWLYKHYCRKLYDYLLLLTADASLAEDSVQEIFLKLWMNREKLRGVCNFNGYLYTMGRNHLVSYWRKQKLERIYIHEVKQSASFYTDERMLELKASLEQYQAAVRSLPERQQAVYRLVREEGRSRAEVSEVLNISPLTVKCTMQHALQKMRQRLKDK